MGYWNGWPRVLDFLGKFFQISALSSVHGGSDYGQSKKEQGHKA